MEIKLNFSEILLYLELLNRRKKHPDLLELKIILYSLQNYEEVKAFYDKTVELNNRLPFKFLTSSYIYFIEDYDDCINIKNKVPTTAKRRYSSLFIQQIRLSKTHDQALKIIEEAMKHGIKLGDVWATRFDSMDTIKSNQSEWRETIKNSVTEYYPTFLEQFNNYNNEYFEGLSLITIRDAIVNEYQGTTNVSKSTVYQRNIYIKEFAKKAADGICQLCEKNAPFSDKYGKPFLEVHHIDYLSNGGTDSIDNVIAICPNCHRKIHYLEDERDYKKLKEKALIIMNLS